jgi:O-antigen ligase
MSSAAVADSSGAPRSSAPRRIAVLLAAALCGALLSSSLIGPISVVFKLLLVVLTAVTLAAPIEGLLALCALFPLGGMIGFLCRLPWRGTQVSESLVVAFLLGWFLRLTVQQRAPWRSPLLLPALSLTAIVSASAVVSTLAILSNRSSPDIGHDLVSILTGNHVGQPLGFQPIYSGLELLLGLALFCAASFTTGSRPADARRVVRMLTVGLVAAATLNVVRFVQISLPAADPISAARSYLQWLRINIHYGDLNAAGSVFGMILLVVVGLIRTTAGWERAGWSACLGVIASALWLAGSRTAIACVLVGAAGAATFEALSSRPGRITRIVVTACAIVLIAAAAMMLLKFPRTQANTDPATAWEIRMELLTRGARMVRDYPVFGVGVGRFLEESDRYATPGSFGPENSHNNFMQILAELGMVGFVTFAWLVSAVIAALRTASDGTSRTFAIWIAAGLGAYLLSAMGGHPLIVFEAAAPFWMLLGVAAHTARAPVGVGGTRYVLPAVLAVLVATLPIRVWATTWALLNPGSTVTWHVDGDVRYRDVGLADTLLVRRPTSNIVLPLRIAADRPEATEAQVEIIVDGQAVNRVVVVSDRWTNVRVLFPRQAGFDHRRVVLRLQGYQPGTRLLVGRVHLR